MDPNKRATKPTNTRTEPTDNEAAPSAATVAVLEPLEDEDEDEEFEDEDEEFEDEEFEDEGEELEDEEFEDEGEELEDEPAAPADLGDLVETLEDPEAPIFGWQTGADGHPQDERARVVALAEALRTGPYHLEVRHIPPAGTPGRGRNLRPVKGHLTVQDLATAATLAEALRDEYEPGDYWLVLRDVRTRKSVADFHVRLNAGKDAAPAVAQIEAQTREAAARKLLRRAQRELAEEEAELAAVRRGRRDESPLEEIAKRLAALEERRSAPPAWLSSLLPAIAPAIAAAAKRLFSAPPSPADALKDLVPLVQTMAEGAMAARNESAAAENRRADAAFHAYLDLLKQRAGVEDDDEPTDSPVALLQQVLAMVRPPPAAAPPAVEPATGPASSQPLRRISPLGMFAAQLVRAHRAGTTAADAAVSLWESWERLPPSMQIALAQQQERVLARLLPAHVPPPVLRQLAAVSQTEDGPAWLSDVLALLAADEEPPAADEPEELDLADPGFSG